MNQPNTATRLEVVDIETNQATKTIYLVGHNALEIQAMSDSLLRNLNTFQFFVRATPSAAPEVVAPVSVGLSEAQIAAGGRWMADNSAEMCGVNRDDNWKVYGEAFIQEFRSALAAAQKAV